MLDIGGNGLTISWSFSSSSSFKSFGSALHVQSNDRPIELTPYELNPLGGGGGWTMVFDGARDRMLVVGESQTIGELSQTLGLIPK